MTEHAFLRFLQITSSLGVLFAFVMFCLSWTHHGNLYTPPWLRQWSTLLFFLWIILWFMELFWHSVEYPEW